MLRHDKNGVFKAEMSKLQLKFDKRLYTTTLEFAHDLCEVINIGIYTEPKSEYDSQPRFELIESPSKPSSKVAERKKVAKRITKQVQSLLETALKSEADITSKSYASLQKELDGMLHASLETRKLPSPKPEAEASGQGDHDVVMEDALQDAPQVDGATGAEGEHMDVDESNIEVKDEDAAEANMRGGTADASDGAVLNDHEERLTNGVKSAPTPPDTNGYMSIPQDSNGPTPLTPPQSNGSLGQATDNMLTEGGIPWYLKAFDPVGTTAIEEQWPGRDVLRALSEELTDMDEAELNDLEFNVEDSTITASPVDVLLGDNQHLVLPGDGLRSGGSRRKVSGAVAGVHKKKLRSSARRR